MRCIQVSSSIENFKEKLERKYPDYEPWKPWRLYEKTLFFGLYHWVDYVRFLIHRGPKKVIWCGADTLNLFVTRWLPLLVRAKATHICENEVERDLLKDMGIEATIQPLYFDDIESIGITYLPSTIPQVYLTAHPGREMEYGVELVEHIAEQCFVIFHIFGVEGLSHANVIYHGKVPSKYFDEMVKHYHGALRLNSFDGFSETLAKSLLMGQYPISYIDYPFVSPVKDKNALIQALNMLHLYKEPNYTAATYYREILCKRVEA